MAGGVYTASVPELVLKYADIIQAIVPTIKMYFPHAKVITSGFANCWINSSPGEGCLQDPEVFLSSLVTSDGHEALQLVDGYGMHLYPASNTSQISLVFNRYTTLPARPFYITEYGL